MSLFKGGQCFPRIESKAVKTIIPTLHLSNEDTRRVFRRCEEEKISFAHVVFALVNVAWIRTMGHNLNPREPM